MGKYEVPPHRTQKEQNRRPCFETRHQSATAD